VPTSELGSAQILLPLAGKVCHMQIESDALTLRSFFRRSPWKMRASNAAGNPSDASSVRH